MYDLQELKKMAEAATPGPWFVAKHPNDDGTVDIETGRLSDWGPCYNCEYGTADFIAAANPETVLALITELEQCRKDAERYRLLRIDGVEHYDNELPAVVIQRQNDWGKFYDAVLDGEELDKAIDAAIAEQEKS